MNFKKLILNIVRTINIIYVIMYTENVKSSITIDPLLLN